MKINGVKIKGAKYNGKVIANYKFNGKVNSFSSSKYLGKTSSGLISNSLIGDYDYFIVYADHLDRKELTGWGLLDKWSTQFSFIGYDKEGDRDDFRITWGKISINQTSINFNSSVWAQRWKFLNTGVLDGNQDSQLGKNYVFYVFGIVATNREGEIFLERRYEVNSPPVTSLGLYSSSNSWQSNFQTFSDASLDHLRGWDKQGKLRYYFSKKDYYIKKDTNSSALTSRKSVNLTELKNDGSDKLDNFNIIIIQTSDSNLLTPFFKINNEWKDLSVVSKIDPTHDVYWIRHMISIESNRIKLQNNSAYIRSGSGTNSIDSFFYHENHISKIWGL